MGKLSRTKGAAFERATAQVYRKLGYKDARRKLDQYQVSGGADLEMTGHWVVQCKCGKNIGWLNAIKEAEGAAKEWEVPVAHLKPDGKGVYVVLAQRDFIELVNQATA